MEGRAIAQRGDWIVEGAGGERWPVTDDQFHRSYTAPEGAALPGTAHDGTAPNGTGPNGTGPPAS
jgi:hypothetical protein